MLKTDWNISCDYNYKAYKYLIVMIVKYNNINNKNNNTYIYV